MGNSSLLYTFVPILLFPPSPKSGSLLQGCGLAPLYPNRQCREGSNDPACPQIGRSRGQHGDTLPTFAVTQALQDIYLPLAGSWQTPRPCSNQRSGRRVSLSLPLSKLPLLYSASHKVL